MLLFIDLTTPQPELLVKSRTTSCMSAGVNVNAIGSSCTLSFNELGCHKRQALLVTMKRKFPWWEEPLGIVATDFVTAIVGIVCRAWLHAMQGQGVRCHIPTQANQRLGEISALGQGLQSWKIHSRKGEQVDLYLHETFHWRKWANRGIPWSDPSHYTQSQVSHSLSHCVSVSHLTLLLKFWIIHSSWNFKY